jgi:hypothetical protein
MLIARIDKFSHFFMVTKIHPSFFPVIKRCLDELIQIQYVKIRGRVQKQATKVFAASNKQRTEFRFHINYFDRFSAIMKDLNHGGGIEIYEHELYEPKDTRYPLVTPSHMKVRDYQEDVLNYCREPGVSKLISLATGKGKHELLNNNIRIPNGWKKMGDLQEGDILSMPNGDEGKVLNIFDFDDKPFYRITFADGRTSECGEEHIWWVYSVHDQYCMNANEWTMIDTKQLYDLCEYHRLRQLNRGVPEDKIYYYLHVPLIDPTHSADKEIDLPIDPYLLGIILGDGCVSKSGRVGIHKPDPMIRQYVFDEVNRIGDQVVDVKTNRNILAYSIKTGHISSVLKAYGLNHKYAWEKFIPEDYMNASFDQRLALIQGLMDTDGSIDRTYGKKGASASEFTTTSKVLADQMLLLLRSVGCIARMKARHTHYTHNGERRQGRLSYRINVRSPIPSMLFRSDAKKQYCKDHHQYSIKGLKLRITKVEKLDKRDKARCIAIDHPDHAYITNDYVVTHNTFTSLKFAEGTNKRLFIVVLARYIEKWQSDVIENFGKDVKLHLVKGGADFYRLLDLAKQEYEMKTPLKKSKFPDVVLVSSNTFQRFLTSWEQATHEEREEMICPHEIFEYMGTGLKILDEAHQHFHLNFKMDLYQHMPKAVYLTATLESNDSFMQRMYQLMWPLNTRDKVLAFNKYDIVHPILYRHNQPERIRCVGGQGYSHVLYEQSIKRHKPSRRQYLDMIGDVVEDYFLPVYAKGRKMLIFCSLVETCELVSEYLLKRFKDQKWQISRFVAGDPKEVIDTNDITVSTLGKAGTALDIPGLIQVLMTVALSEPKANLQAKGRNRDLSSKPGFEGITPKFFYFVGTDLPKHWQYHKEKETLFKDRTLAIQSINTPYVIGEPMDRYLSYQGNKDNGF